MPSAAILAGGHASRFGGRDKSGLVVGGRTILERQLAELAVVTDDIMIVGHAPAPDTPGGATVRAVPDRARGLGPLGGLDAALAAARHDRVVVLACDMPFVTAALVEYLIDIAEGSEGNDVVVPRTERGYHPLCAVYSRACHAVVSRRIASGRLSIRGIFDDVRVRVVTGEELDAFGDRNHLLANVNTLAEYEELETLHGHHA